MISSEQFTEMYETYYPVIRGFMQRLCHDHAKAEDIAQDTFLELWKWETRNAYDETRGTAFSYLCRIAVNRLYRSWTRDSLRDKLLKAKAGQWPQLELKVAHEQTSRDRAP